MNHVGKAFDRKTLTGKVAGQYQADGVGFGIEAGVESGFADDHRVATGFDGVRQELARRSARDCNRADFPFRSERFALGRFLKSFLPFRRVRQRYRLFEPAPTTCAVADCVGNKRRDASQLQPFRQTLVDARAGGIERRMRTVDGNLRRDYFQKNMPDDRVGGQLLHGMEGEGVVRDDQIDLLANRLAGGRRRDGQAGHDPFDVLIAVADQQTDVIP